MQTLKPEPIDQIVKLFQIVKGIKTPTFVRILNYSNDKSNLTEKANYLIDIGINYENAKNKDSITILSEIGTANNRLHELALRELLLSNELITEDSQKRSQAQKDAYVHVLPNIKVHKVSGCVYITGFVVRKQIVIQGTYKPEYVSPLVQEKNQIRRDLKATKYRQFKINKLSLVRLMGEEIVIDLEENK
jgi:hypothetical protein